MQEKHLYEYAVIRVFPMVEREEFINVGIILYSKQAAYLKLCYYISEKKLQAFSDNYDIESLETNLKTFQKIAMGSTEGGAIALLDISERFRWLTAEKSSCLQTSRPHPGFSSDLDKTLQKLFNELVK